VQRAQVRYKCQCVLSVASLKMREKSHIPDELDHERPA
jgi:hypothetical protein